MQILRKLAYVVGAVAWFAIVFVFGLYVTFPSTALADFARWKVQGNTDQWRLAVSQISPSGFGARADDVTLFKKDRTKTTPVVTAEHVYLSSGPWSLVNLALGGTSTIKGSIVREGGDLSFSTTIARADNAVKVHAASLDAEELPLAALPAIQGARIRGTGGVDVHVDLKGPEGLAKANGKVTIGRGESLVIEGLDAPGTPLDGMSLGGPVNVSVFDLQFDVKNGKGKVSSGTIQTDLANIEVQGDFTLSDVLTQSRLRLKFLITLTDQFDSQLGLTASLAKGLMGEAWSDGARHFALSGTLGMPRFRVEHERKSTPRPTGGAPAAGSGGEVEGDEEGVTPPVQSVPISPPGDAADRAARREQAISDRRARMEERRRQLQNGGSAPAISRPGMMPPMGAPGLAAGMAPPPPSDNEDEELPPGVPVDDGAEDMAPSAPDDGALPPEEY